MTYTTQASHSSLWQRLSDLRSTLAERRAQGKAYRTTVSELSAMSQRDLTDMGIHRADIDAIARQAVYGA